MPTDDGEAFDWLWLSCLPLGRAVDRTSLAIRAGGVHALAAAPGDRLREAGFDDKTIRILKDGRSREEASRLGERAAALGLAVLHPDHASYPPLLRTITDMPPVLYCKGDPVGRDRCIAVVGSRRCTGYGVTMAERLSCELAEAGFTIVSGLARGIDTAAHAGAMRAGGRTAAILANGLAMVYPPENRGLAARMLERGCLMTESAPDVEPMPYRFPFRNRIISGMAEAVLVVEAGEKSGSLITVQYALDQGREVFAVPGNATSICSRGCNRIIREGAGLVQDAADLVASLGKGWSPQDRMEPPGSLGGPSSGASIPPACPPDQAEACRRLEPPAPKARRMSLPQHIITGRLAREALDEDRLACQTGLSAQELAVSLVELELAGIVRRGFDGLYRLLP